MSKHVAFVAATLSACFAVGCSSGGGLFQPPKQSGIIVARFVGTQTALTSSANSPLPVDNGFAISLSETNYSATFTAAVVSFTAPTTGPCYVVSMNATGTVATFVPRATSALNGSGTSPCAQPGSDIESVLFSDQQKNTLTLYFENRQGATPGAILTFIEGTSTPLSTSLSSPQVVNNGFVLSLSESNYTGPFTASIIAHTAPTALPCYTVSMDSTGTIATFAPQASQSRTES